MINMFIKRIYEPYEPGDGRRILVDRLWPRGISKEAARLDSWEKEIAPSHELRKEFRHMPERFEEFRMKYLEELRGDEDKIQKLEQLCEMVRKEKVTLLYGARDPVYNHARVLQEELLRMLGENQ